MTLRHSHYRDIRSGLYLPQAKPVGDVVAERQHPDCPDYWWPCLSGAGNLTEIVQGNNPGIITGSDWDSYHEGRDRVIGPFGTNDYVDTGLILPSHNQWTKCCWLHRTTAGQNRYGLIAVVDSDIRIGFYQYVNTIYIAVSNGVSAYATRSSFNDVGWSHFTMVYDGTATGNVNRLKFYINGDLESLTFVGTIPSTVNVNASVKFHNNAAYFSHSAFSDDHRIYKRAVNQDSINRIISEPWSALKPARRPWIPVVIDGGFTGTAAGTLDQITADSSGTFTPGAVTGTAAGTLVSITGTASGTFTAAAITGTGAGLLESIIADASGTFTSLAITGTAAGTIELITADASGTFSAADFQGTGAGILATITGDATGTLNVSGTAAGVMAVITADASGTFALDVTGTAAGTLEAIIAAGTGTVPVDVTVNPDRTITVSIDRIITIH